jgi:Xaa-Pro aminopeptidase
MRAEDLDCLIIYGAYQEMYQQNARYVSGYTDLLQFYVLLPLEAEPILLTHSAPQVPNARQVAAIADTRWGGPNISQTVCDHIAGMGLHRGNLGLVGIESLRNISVPAEHMATFTQQLPNAKWRVVTGLLEDIRRLKSAEEIEFLHRGGIATDRALQALVQAAHPGRAEYEVLAAMRYAAYVEGATPSFAYLCSTPMAQPTIAFPAFAPSTRRLATGDVLIAETAVAVGGISGSAARTLTLGQPTGLYRDLYAVAEETYRRITAALRPGASEADIVEATRPITEAGLTVQGPVLKGWDNKIEKPLAGVVDDPAWPTLPFVLQPNQVVAVGPNPCTRDLQAGVMLANLHLITDDGQVCLQRFPTDLVVA